MARRGERRGHHAHRAVARRIRPRRRGALLWLLDWIPARLTALSFAIVGDFEDAVFCWRTQAKAWADEEGGEHAGIVLASGAGALGVMLGGPIPVVGRRARRPARARSGRSAGSRSAADAVGLVWRALVLWLLLMLLLTLANWAP